ncbi:Ig-like domain repeat protein [Terriglobus sp. RCC_193]|uniref:Ig-like domain repeat protein n=1 Tax=Terriglobus sp. RCC_193 TaxID=3239218 RepID=UPI0035238D3E
MAEWLHSLMTIPLLSRRFAAVLFAVLFCLSLHAQTTIRVPADKPTIQSAIDSSSNGGTVIVAPGTYYVNLDFHGRNITVTSSDGPATTILDGSSTGPVVAFGSGETSQAILSGFTIRNGSGSGPSNIGGGGVYIHYASPTIQNNIFTDNACTSINAQGSPTITGNTITRTHTYNPVSQCTYRGTAILLYGGSRAHATRNTIIGNTESGNGTILVWASEDAVIENNIFRNNSPASAAAGCGATICMFNASRITIDGNEISNNSSNVANSASAIHLGLLDLTAPGLLPLGAPLIRILNNTIANNGTGALPQVFIDSAHARVQVVNNIVSSNSGAPGFLCRLNSAYATVGNVPVFVFNDSYTAGIPFSSDCGADATHGNITSDPQLSVDAKGNLAPHSAAVIDTGSNSVLPQPATDLEGNPRTQGSAPVNIDMGAIELPGMWTGPQNRIIQGPSRYVTGPDNITVTYALVLSGTTSWTTNNPVTLYVDGVAAQTQDIIVNNAPPYYSGSFSIGLSPGQHELQVRFAETNGARAISLPTRVYVSSTPASSALVVMNVDSQTYVGSKLSGQVRCRLNQNQSLQGHMRIFDNGNLLVDAIPTGTADVYATFFADAGSHQYECDYEGLDFNDSIVNSQILSNSAPSVGGLYSLPDPSEYGDPVTIGGSTKPFPAGATGHLRVTEGSTVILDKGLDATGDANIVTTTLTPGRHTFQGVLTSSIPGADITGVFSQTVHFAPTTLSLAGNPTSGTTATPIVLTTAASSSYKGTALTGTISILDNGTKLGIAGVLNGNVTLPAGTLTGGTHVLTAVYSGTTIFAPSTSNTVTITLTVPPPPDFSISPTGPTLSVQTEHHATTKLTLTSMNNFNGSVSLTCGNLPPVATCTFDRGRYALSSTAAVSFVVETSTITNFKSETRSMAPSTIALCLLPAAGMLFFVPRRRLPLFMAALVTILLLGTTACSGKYPDHTPPGTYAVTITATGVSGGTSVTHTVPFRLIVAPE